MTVILCALLPFAYARGDSLFGVSVALAVLIALASASFDIVVDAYRIERLSAQALGAGTAVHSAAWYVGARLVGGIVILLLAESLGWPLAYLVAGGSLAILLPVLWLSPEPDVRLRPSSGDAGVLRRLGDAVLDPLRDLWCRFGSALVTVFLFVVFFKLQDAMAGALSGPFVRVIGYEKDTIAWVYKGFGLVATFGGMFLAGLLAARRSLLGPLWLAVGAQILSNLGFSWLAVVAGLARLAVEGGCRGRCRLAGACRRDRFREPRKRLRQYPVRGLSVAAGRPRIHGWPVCAAFGAGADRTQLSCGSGGLSGRIAGLAAVLRDLGRGRTAGCGAAVASGAPSPPLLPPGQGVRPGGSAVKQTRSTSVLASVMMPSPFGG